MKLIVGDTVQSLSKTVAAILKTVYERELGVGDGILSSFNRDTENSRIVDRSSAWLQSGWLRIRFLGPGPYSGS